MALRSLNHDFIVHEAMVLVLRLLDAILAHDRNGGDILIGSSSTDIRLTTTISLP